MFLFPNFGRVCTITLPKPFAGLCMPFCYPHPRREANTVQGYIATVKQVFGWPERKDMLLSTQTANLSPHTTSRLGASAGARGFETGL